MSKKYIDNSKFMELVSELAHEVTLAHFDDEAMIEEDDITYYSDEAQDFFDEKYDDITTFINGMGVYSDNDK
jgi:ribosome assembly protein YihI (activator of Der GTPase)